VILSGGAYRLRLAEVAAAAARALSLGVVGFLFSIAAMCAYLWLATNLELVRPATVLHWMMIGAIVGGTSALVIMPTIAKSPVDPRVGRTLDVESSSTDALSVVIAMVLIDLLVTGEANVARPIIALAKGIGIGIALGVAITAVLIPLVPALRDKPHGFTVFLASMLALYAIANHAGGNGAVAVLASALLLGNASLIMPKLIPGARAQAFTNTDVSRIMQEQMSFLVKSFFFFLIGLMFPTDLRLIGLGAAAALFLLVFRVPAVMLAMLGQGLSRKQLRLLVVTMPRGLAAGVLATLPQHLGVTGVENLSAAVFATIVATILLFAIGFALVNRMPEEKKLK
jgi:cell volume regulation protein A